MPRNRDILIRFGKKLRDLRSARGYSQESFAAKCGLDRTYVGGIERGERNLALLNLDKIARALEMTLTELLDDL